MSLLEKIETLLNALLFKLGALFLKLIPAPIKNKCAVIQQKFQNVLSWLKPLPMQLIKRLIEFVKSLKSQAGALNVKAKLSETYALALARYKEKSPGAKQSQFKKILFAPFLVIGQWLNGLSVGQSMLLMTFSAGSFLAVLGIFFSGHRLATGQGEGMRAPASVPEEVAYERPEYYKKQTRHFNVVNLRLPVYFAKVNEIKSVDIDFTATLSNRYSKLFLEKNEFHLRDHLILQLEPSVSSFPLQDEGKDILRDKILSEVNEFLRQNEVDGHVEELKITYVLAN